MTYCIGDSRCVIRTCILGEAGAPRVRNRYEAIRWSDVRACVYNKRPAITQPFGQKRADRKWKINRVCVSDNGQFPYTDAWPIRVRLCHYIYARRFNFERVSLLSAYVCVCVYR